MNTDVCWPNEPPSTTEMLGDSRSASSTVVTPRARRSSPVMTVVLSVAAPAALDSRVAVTTTSLSVAVSEDAPCACALTGTAPTSASQREYFTVFGMENVDRGCGAAGVRALRRRDRE